MNTIKVDVPYEFEALALYMGVTPKKAAAAVLGWFAVPLGKAGLVVADPETRGGDEIRDAVADFARLQRMDRGEALLAIPQLRQEH